MEETALRPVQGSPPRLIPQGGIADTRRRAEGEGEKVLQSKCRHVITYLSVYFGRPKICNLIKVFRRKVTLG